MDYEIFRDVQHINGYIFYSYMNFSKSIYKPWVKIDNILFVSVFFSLSLSLWCIYQVSFFHRIFTRITSLHEYPRLVFDSNRIVGTFVEHAYSPNGEHCAFTISVGNQNMHKIMVIDVRTGKPFGKCLRQFGCEKIAWSGDSQGFFIYVNIVDFCSILIICSGEINFNFFL